MNDPEQTTLTTYKRADGEPVAGEYSWVTDLEFFDEEAAFVDRLEVIAETWTLTQRKVLAFGPTERWCAECDEDITLDEPTEGRVYCTEHRPVP